MDRADRLRIEAEAEELFGLPADADRAKRQARRALIWTRAHTRRALIVKGIVTLSFVAYIIDHSFALPVALLGNLVWVWVDPE